MKLITVILVLVIVLMIGCSKDAPSTTGLATSDGGISSETKVQIMDKDSDTLASSCKDSDSGIDKEIAGKVEGTTAGEEFTNFDTCIAGLLVEYFCEDDKPVNQNVRCPEGSKCAGGACRSI